MKGKTTDSLFSKFNALRDGLKEVNEQLIVTVVSDTLDLIEDILLTASKKEDEHELLDRMEVDAVNAVENIMSHLHCDDIKDTEKDMLKEAINSLIALGKKYE